ncbi:hypothetical protein [Micromonospora sp. CA-111912]|uniref:hypothetical protein n=1 Tax=Micromonospora sp. CA-111912 TaxID=3239955 RepID=UPI003D8FD06D
MDERRKELLESAREARDAAEAAVPPEVFQSAREADRLTQEVQSGKLPEGPEAQLEALRLLQRNTLVRGVLNDSRFYDFQRAAQEVERLTNLNVKDCVEVTVFDRYEEVFGNVDEVLAELDRRSTLGIVFRSDGMRGPDSLYRSLSDEVRDGVYIRLGKGRYHRSTGAEVSVTSTSTGWARSSFARICDEMEKGVPTWALASRLAPAIFVLLVAAPFAAIAIALGGGNYAWWSVVACCGVLFAATVSRLSERFMGWLLPPFEISAEGSESSGTRRLVTILATVSTIPIGVFVNLIS